MATHTPGPWETADSGTVAHKPGWRTVVQSPTRLIAFTGTPLPIQNHLWVKEDEANARLIAAAPDLLKACEYAIGCAEGRIRDYDGVLQPMLVAAIAKACDGSPANMEV